MSGPRPLEKDLTGSGDRSVRATGDRVEGRPGGRCWSWCDRVDDGKVARMVGEDWRNLASNSPYGQEDQQEDRRARRRTPRGSGPVDPERGRRMLTQEAEAFLRRVGPPAGQEQTLPPYRAQADTWERPLDSHWAEADAAALARLQDEAGERGRGTPPAEDSNWENRTLDPDQAAAVVGMLQQPLAPDQSVPGRQPPGYPGGHQQPYFQGHLGGTTLSPEQLAHFSQQIGRSQSSRADPAVLRQALEQAQAFSATDFPGRGFGAPFQGTQQSRPSSVESGSRPPPPTNPVAGHANASLPRSHHGGAGAGPSGDGQGLRRSGAVRHGRGQREAPKRSR